MKRKRITAMLLALVLAASVTACGEEKSSDKSSDGNDRSDTPELSGAADISGGDAQDNETASSAEPEILTVENAEVRLVYAEGSYVMLAFHGPRHDVGMHLCQKDGSNLNGGGSLGYWHPSDSWTLAVTFELSEEYSIGDLALSVMDYSAPKTEEGRYPETLFTDFGEPMSDEELKAIGVSFLEGHGCMITDDNRLSYGSDNFRIVVYAEGMGKDKDFLLTDEGLTEENFQFYVGDGTPLVELFDGYTLEIEVGGLFGKSVTATFRDSASDSSEGKNKSMCDTMRASSPYMLYIGKDGTTQQFPLLVK